MREPGGKRLWGRPTLRWIDWLDRLDEGTKEIGLNERHINSISHPNTGGDGF